MPSVRQLGHFSALHKKRLAHGRRIGALKARDVISNHLRQDNFSTTVHQARFGQAMRQSYGQGWWQLYLLVPGFFRLMEVESLHL